MEPLPIKGLIQTATANKCFAARPVLPTAQFIFDSRYARLLAHVRK